MNRFLFNRADSSADAVSLGMQPGSRFIAGGTNLVDLMKQGVEHPSQLIDINRLPLNRIRPAPGGGLRIGALVTNAETADDLEVQRRYPLLAEAILAGASPQLRNMASTGGNLLQRTRCYYFYEVGLPCNKREPGTGCAARCGHNRMHAILGHSESCIAVHPSDMCVAMAALEATVQVEGPDGPRAIPFAEFHRLPGDEPQRDSNLKPGELVTAVDLPEQGFARHYAYLKLRDRQSYAFALVSVAAALDLHDGRIRQARLALGGVAHKPWRVKAAEESLLGRPLEREAFERAAELTLQGAQGLQHNRFKIEMARRAIVRALGQAAGTEEKA